MQCAAPDLTQGIHRLKITNAVPDVRAHRSSEQPTKRMNLPTIRREDQVGATLTVAKTQAYQCGREGFLKKVTEYYSEFGGRMQNP